jgi:hypothetical protein
MQTAIDNNPGMASKLISFRTTDPGTEERVARLVKHLKGLAAYKGVKVSESTVNNMAHLRGLDALEDELGLRKRAKR